MPISGFRVGDEVLTPSGKQAVVKAVRRAAGRELVLVALCGLALADKWFDACALRLKKGRR
jgi:hypothetical protein